MKKLFVLIPLALIQSFCVQAKLHINQQPKIFNECVIDCFNKRLSLCIDSGAKGQLKRDEKNAEEWLSLKECQESCSKIKQKDEYQESIETQKRSLKRIWSAIKNILNN